MVMTANISNMSKDDGNICINVSRLVREKPRTNEKIIVRLVTSEAIAGQVDAMKGGIMNIRDILLIILECDIKHIIRTTSFS